jgi:hypothetical protein
MAKKFYGTDMQGPLYVERLGSHPVVEQGRIYNYTVDGYIWANKTDMPAPDRDCPSTSTIVS